MLFNKAGKLGAHEIPFICTEQSTPEPGAVVQVIEGGQQQHAGLPKGRPFDLSGAELLESKRGRNTGRSNHSVKMLSSSRRSI